MICSSSLNCLDSRELKIRRDFLIGLLLSTVYLPESVCYFLKAGVMFRREGDGWLVC